jgi:hypothetical protein
MTSISGANSAASTAATRRPPPPPPPPQGSADGASVPGRPGAPKGENSALDDEDKLSALSDLLDMGSDQVAGQATSASNLVNLFKQQGVDLSTLRAVLDNGDLFDMNA